jgi:PBP1b-binding outer membrane lipoprotein LpoB
MWKVSRVVHSLFKDTHMRKIVFAAAVAGAALSLSACSKPAEVTSAVESTASEATSAVDSAASEAVSAVDSAASEVASH